MAACYRKSVRTSPPDWKMSGFTARGSQNTCSFPVAGMIERSVAGLHDFEEPASQPPSMHCQPNDEGSISSRHTQNLNTQTLVGRTRLFIYPGDVNPQAASACSQLAQSQLPFLQLSDMLETLNLNQAQSGTSESTKRAGSRRLT